MKEKQLMEESWQDLILDLNKNQKIFFEINSIIFQNIVIDKLILISMTQPF